MAVKTVPPLETARPKFKSHLHYLLVLRPTANLPLWYRV